MSQKKVQMKFKAKHQYYEQIRLQILDFPIYQSISSSASKNTTAPQPLMFSSKYKEVKVVKAKTWYCKKLISSNFEKTTRHSAIQYENIFLN